MADLPKLDPRERHFRIPEEHGLTLSPCHLGAASSSSVRKLVLYIHRATFLSAHRKNARFALCHETLAFLEAGWPTYIYYEPKQRRSSLP
jgi:hypothetical protein